MSTELQKGATAFEAAMAYSVPQTFEVPMINRLWNEDDDLEDAALKYTFRRWRHGEKRQILEARDRLIARLEASGEAALSDPIGRFFDRGVPNRDEAWAICLIQALLVSPTFNDVELAQLVAECPEWLTPIMSGLDENLKTQLSSAEQLSIALEKKTLKMISEASASGKPANSSSTSPPDN